MVVLVVVVGVVGAGTSSHCILQPIRFVLESVVKVIST